MRSVKTSLFFMAMSAVLALSGSARATEGPISYWKFDEGSGTTAYDSIGNNHGTINGASWTTGIVNTALNFDGVYNYVDCADVGPLGGLPRTVCAWAKTLSTDSQMILSYGGYWNGYGTAFRLGLNLFGGVEGVSADISVGDATYCATVADGEWHHYAAVVPSVGLGPPLMSDVKVYQDGELLSTICASNGLWVPVNTGGDNPIDIGQSYALLFGQYWQTFNGIIDEVALYDKALTDEEIMELYKHGLGPKIVAIENIEGAISEKVETLERIDVALGREWLAYAALEELLASGNYGDLNKADIIRARQDIFAAIQQQEQSKNSLEQSLQKLKDSLRLLGAEVQP